MNMSRSASPKMAVLKKYSKEGGIIMRKHVSVRLPREIYNALEAYCKDNYIDKSTIMRTALIHWEPMQKYLYKERKK